MTRLRPLLLALLLAACSASPSAAPPTPAPTASSIASWPMFRGDLARDGHPPGATLTAATAATLRLAWQTALGSPIEGSPAVAGGLLVAGTTGGTLAALTAAKGETVWTATGLGSLPGPPLIAEGKVFAGSSDGHVYALELLTGARIWDWRAPGDRPAIVGGPVLYRGLLLVGIGAAPGAPPEPGRLVALDPPSGRQLWVTCLRPACAAGDGIASSIAVDSEGIGFVSAGGPDDSLVAFDVGIGKILWTHPLPSTGSTPLFLGGAAGRELVAVTGPTWLTMVSAAAGTAAWSQEGSSAGPASSTSGSPGSDARQLYVPLAGTPAGLHAVALADRQAAWSHDTQLPVFSSPAVGKDVVVLGEGALAGGTAGALVAVSSRDGHEVWRFESGAAVVASPAIVGDSVYSADLSGRVLAFRP